MCTKENLAIIDQGITLEITKNKLWPVLQGIREDPHIAQNPFMSKKLGASLLAPLAQIGITSLRDIIAANGTEIISTSELTRAWGGKVDGTHRRDLNRITLLVTGQYAEGTDPLSHNSVAPLDKKQRTLPQQWRILGGNRQGNKKNIMELLDTLPHYTRPTSEIEEDQTQGNPTTSNQQRNNQNNRRNKRLSKANKRLQTLERGEAGRRNSTICCVQKDTPEGREAYLALLAKGKPRAILALYDGSDLISVIRSHRQRGEITQADVRPRAGNKRKSTQIIHNKTTEYEVQWSDTLMKNEDAKAHLECYAKLGYYPSKTSKGESSTTVTWKFRYENLSTLENVPNWKEAKAEYEEAIEDRGNHVPQARRDASLTNMQRQGGWTAETNDHTTEVYTMREFIHLDGTPCNPDLDIEPSGLHTMQEGLGQGGEENGDYTYFYDPQGRYTGHLPNHIVYRSMAQIVQRDGFTFNMASAQIASLIRRYPHQAGNYTNTRQLEKYSRLPLGFIMALRELNIRHEEHTHPLQVSKEMESYSSVNKADVAVGASGCAFDHEWTRPALVQWPASLDIMHKTIRWALASARKETASFTLFAMPDSSSSQHQQYLQYDQYYSLGTVLMHKISQPQHWHTKDRTSERTLTDKMRFRVRIVLVANKDGLAENITDIRWSNFLAAIAKAKVADAGELCYPHKTHTTPEPSFKPPKAFVNLTPLPNYTDEPLQEVEPRVCDPWYNNMPKRQPPKTSNTQNIYTDGSCIKGAPGTPNQVGAAFVVIKEEGVVTCTINPNGKGPTNTVPRAEMSAIHMALKHIHENQYKDATIYTDSLSSIYLIRHAQFDPRKVEWSILIELLEKIVVILKQRAKDGMITNILKVKGHSGVKGNVLADQAAVRAALGKQKNSDIQQEETTTSEARGSTTWLAAVATDERGGESLRLLNDLSADPKKHVSPSLQAGAAEDGVYWKLRREVLQYISQSHSAAHWTICDIGANILNMKLENGIVWNRAKAHQCYPEKCTSSKCPHCSREDGCSHIYGGCLHKEMKALYIARHNAAVLKIYEAIQKGELHNCVTIMDATTKEKMPRGVESTRIEPWVLPKVPDEIRKKLRPDLLIFEGLDRGMLDNFKGLKQERKNTMKNCTVHIIEVGYASSTRYLEKREEKSDQHTQLYDLLKAEGWNVQYTEKHKVILGTSGTIFKPTVSLFEDILKISKAKTDSTLNKLSAHAVYKGRDIITCRRKLDASQLPTSMHPCNRRYNSYHDS